MSIESIQRFINPPASPNERELETKSIRQESAILYPPDPAAHLYSRETPFDLSDPRSYEYRLLQKIELNFVQFIFYAHHLRIDPEPTKLDPDIQPKMTYFAHIRTIDLSRTIVNEKLLHSITLLCKSAISINLSHCQNIDELWPLTHLESLRSLNLREVPLKNYVALLGLTQLTSLNLTGWNQIKSFKSLRTFVNLTELDLTQCSSMVAIDFLRAITRLVKLLIPQCREVNDFSPIGSCKELRVLDITDTSIEDASVLNQCVQLEQLEMAYCTRFTTFTRAPETQFTGLTSLNLIGCYSLKEISFLRSMPNLKALNLDSCAKIEDFDPISTLTLLENLNLSRCTLLTSFERTISPLINLKSLKLEYLEQLEDISFLRPLLHLKHLSLRYSDIRNFDALRFLKGLSILDLTGCSQIGLSSAVFYRLQGNYPFQSVIGNLTSLEILNLTNCNLRSCFSGLANCTKLRALSLKHNLDLDGFSAIYSLPRLEYVNFSTTARHRVDQTKFKSNPRIEFKHSYY